MKCEKDYKLVNVLGVMDTNREMLLGLGEIGSDYVILDTVFDRQFYKRAFNFDGFFVNDEDIELVEVLDYKGLMIPNARILRIYSYNAKVGIGKKIDQGLRKVQLEICRV